ncbi:MAG: YitT family protein [Erysipelotrichaceae bacterium]|nr:YitT family protein [Erysipelotrichaceae bacterium]
MKKFKSIFMIVLGNFLLAVSVSYFVLPYNVLSGGCAGIALITRELFGWNTTITIDVLVILFFILGYLFLGREFTLKTALSSAVYPVFITLLSWFDIRIEADQLLMSIFGAVVAGAGVGIVIRENASTGGTDVPPMIVHKYTGMPIPVLMAITDGILVIAGLLAYNIQDVMIGLIYIYISNAIINEVIMPRSSSVALFIISDRKDEIMSYIHDSLERGTTIVPARGGYTDNAKEVIMTVLSKNQYNLLAQQIERIDPKAFIIVSDAKDVKGEGFSYDYRV